MARIVSIILNTVLIIMLFGAGGLFLASKMEIPGHIEMKIVKSGSMEPTIKTGGIVLIKPADTYQVGDIVTFGEDTRSHVPTTHRIVSIRVEDGTTLYSTKGDANEEADAGETAANLVIGKVFFTVPYAGYILDFSKRPLGFVLLIGIPAGVIILFELLAIYEEMMGALRKRPRVQPATVRYEEPIERDPIPEFPWDRTLDLRRSDI